MGREKAEREKLNGTLYFSETKASILEYMVDEGIIDGENKVYQETYNREALKAECGMIEKVYMYVLTEDGQFFRVYDDDFGKSPRREGYEVTFEVPKKRGGKWRWAKNIELIKPISGRKSKRRQAHEISG